MDGSGFLRDLPAPQAFGPAFGSPRGGGNGILYVEDFDAPHQPAKLKARDEDPPPAPSFAAQDVESAYEAGRQEGLQSALTDATLVQAQLLAAATQALADALSANRRALENVAAKQAQGTAQMLVAILAAAIPDTMTHYAQAEVQAVVAALLPGLRCEAELRVRTHPDCADIVRETLAAQLAAEGTVISVMADPALAEGDVHVTWAEGGARRDTAQIYADIRAALSPLNLPSFEDMCCGKRE